MSAKTKIDYKNVKSTRNELDSLYNSRVKKAQVLSISIPYDFYINKVKKNVETFADELGKLNKDIKSLINTLDTAYNAMSNAEKPDNNKDGKNGKNKDKNKPKKLTKKRKNQLVAAIIAGKYGNGDIRKQKLKKLGYTDKQIQSIQNAVNKKIKGPNDSGTSKDISTNSSTKNKVVSTVPSSSNKTNKNTNAKKTKKVSMKDGFQINMANGRASILRSETKYSMR